MLCTSKTFKSILRMNQVKVVVLVRTTCTPEREVEFVNSLTNTLKAGFHTTADKSLQFIIIMDENNKILCSENLQNDLVLVDILTSGKLSDLEKETFQNLVRSNAKLFFKEETIVNVVTSQEVKIMYTNEHVIESV